MASSTLSESSLLRRLLEPRLLAALAVVSCASLAASVPFETLFRVTAATILGAAAVVAVSRRRRHELGVGMETIVRFASDAIFTSSLDGTITSWNPAAEELFGLTAKEAVGRNIRVLVPPDCEREESAVVARIFRGEVVAAFETERTRKDGTRVPVELTVSPVKSSRGSIVGLSNIVRDIRERKELAADRDAHLRREQAARADAEAALEAKDDFLALLSHELRTPLNAVSGWARMMQTGRLDDGTVARALDAIVRNANVQVRLIDDVLDVSRIARSTLRLDVRSLELRDVIEDALDDVLPAAKAKGVALESRLDPRGATIAGDAGRLRQIVCNLVVNAVKFTPCGGRVLVHMRRTPEVVKIVVSDTGQGIPAHRLPLVFEQFRHWDRSDGRSPSGLGLGLALVKHLAESHHGSVLAESDGEGKGARFTVTLPLSCADQEREPAWHHEEKARPFQLKAVPAEGWPARRASAREALGAHS